MVGNRAEFHVVPPNDWSQVKRDGNPVVEIPTKADAVDKASAKGRLGHPAQVIIRPADGLIDDEHSYDDDPFPPHG